MPLNGDLKYKLKRDNMLLKYRVELRFIQNKKRMTQAFNRSSFSARVQKVSPLKTSILFSFIHLFGLELCLYTANRGQ